MYIAAATCTYVYYTIIIRTVSSVVKALIGCKLYVATYWVYRMFEAAECRLIIQLRTVYSVVKALFTVMEKNIMKWNIIYCSNTTKCTY